jgi:hypothetical protein
MISGFNLIQNSISSSQPTNTQTSVQPQQPIHGFQFIQNSIHSQQPEQQRQQQRQQLLHSIPNSNSIPNSRITYPSYRSYLIEEQDEQEEQEEQNEYPYRYIDDEFDTSPNYASTNSNNPNNYITLTFANATYLTIITAKLTYQPLSGMYKYLTVVDASNIYLRIVDASNTYLQIVDASNTYLQIVDASNTYLSRLAGNQTSVATSTSFSGKISVQGATFCCDTGGDSKLGISLSISDTSQIGSGTVVVGGSGMTNCSASNAVIVGTNAKGSNNSVAIGNNCGSTQADNVTIGFNASSNASNCVTIGVQASSNANNCVALGAFAKTDDSATQSVAIGYNSQATLANQIMLGTSAETVYCPGNPISGSTLNTCLVLSSNVTLNNLTSTPPTTGQLGYTSVFTISNTPTTISNTPTTTTTYATINPLGVGTWLITGVVTVTSTSTLNSIFTISMNTDTASHNSKQLIVNQNFLYPDYLTTSFNYSNVIYNTTSQAWYILISVDAGSSTSTYTSSTGAYMNATRIA